jgi:hypothetical protein
MHCSDRKVSFPSILGLFYLYTRAIVCIAVIAVIAGVAGTEIAVQTQFRNIAGIAGIGRHMRPLAIGGVVLV